MQQAEQRGYIVIAPAAPDGDLFFEEGARVFPEFLTKILADYKILDGKFHVAEVSKWRQVTLAILSPARQVAGLCTDNAWRCPPPAVSNTQFAIV
jgi:hypothetical protein